MNGAEAAYLSEDRLARLATVGADGSPHVVPVGFRYDPEEGTIEVRGRRLERTRKFRDVGASGRAAIVVDDLASVDPWMPRGVEVRGRAVARMEPEPAIVIEAEKVVSWGLGKE
jgi:pyridoxamine 5'-phosphate oxidase family protein